MSEECHNFEHHLCNIMDCECKCHEEEFNELEGHADELVDLYLDK